MMSIQYPNTFRENVSRLRVSQKGKEVIRVGPKVASTLGPQLGNGDLPVVKEEGRGKGVVEYSSVNVHVLYAVTFVTILSDSWWLIAA